jgi:hypothetical protein
VRQILELGDLQDSDRCSGRQLYFSELKSQGGSAYSAIFRDTSS